MSGEGLSDEFRAKWMADLIAREREWITARTGWNLTTQGFLIAGLGLSSRGHGALAPYFQVAVPALGLAISALTALSIFAAYHRHRAIRSDWTERFSDFGILEPVSTERVHFLGALSARAMPLVICAFWGGLLWMEHCR